VYNNSYSRADLIVEGSKTPACYNLASLLEEDWQKLKKISIREAAANNSPVGGQGMIHCNCQTKCDSDRCSCRKGEVFCNSRCHKNDSKCLNCCRDK
jgi:hypothetical protein